MERKCRRGGEHATYHTHNGHFLYPQAKPQKPLRIRTSFTLTTQVFLMEHLQEFYIHQITRRSCLYDICFVSVPVARHGNRFRETISVLDEGERERALCVTKFNGVSVRNGEEEASRHSKGREDRKKLDQ